MSSAKDDQRMNGAGGHTSDAPVDSRRSSSVRDLGGTARQLDSRTMRSSAAPYGAHMPIGRLVVAWVDNLFRVSDARSFEHELGLAQGGEGQAVLCIDLRGMAEVGPDLLVELAQALG